MQKSKVQIQKTYEKGPLIGLTEEFFNMLGQLMKKLENQLKIPGKGNLQKFDKNQIQYSNCLEICDFLLYLDKNKNIPNKIGLVTLDTSIKADHFDVILLIKEGNMEIEQSGIVGVHGIVSYFITEVLEEMNQTPELNEEAIELPLFQSSNLTKKQIGTMVSDFLVFYNRWVNDKDIIPTKEPKSTTNQTISNAPKSYNYYDDYYDYPTGEYGTKSKTTTPYSGSWGGYGYGGNYGTGKKDYSLSRGELVNVPEFSYNPRNVRSTFLSLTTETYPHGHEEEVLKYLPVPGLQKDQWGNYYLIIGKSDTMFTSHLDTASRTKSAVRVMSYQNNGDEIFVTDGTSILGADDKAGVTVMLFMISHNIPGVYYFFIGEEVGAVGSSKVAENFDTISHLRGMKKCISFDRRDYHSVITSQLSQSCCSTAFAESLCETLNNAGMQLRLDNTGVFTDSASFMDLIPECTNISVGYFSEHRHEEKQNISYLERLAKACIVAKWDNLVIKRRVGLDPSISAKYASLIKKLKKARIWSPKKAYTDEESFYINVTVDETPILTVKRELESYKRIFDEMNKENQDEINHPQIKPTIVFDTGFIKFKFN